MRSAAWLVMLAVAGGCVTSGTVIELNVPGEPLQYPPATGPAPVKGPTTVRIAKVAVVAPTPASTSMTLLRKEVLFLLLGGYLDERWRCELGAAQIANDPEGFIRFSLAEEIRRGSRRTFVDGPADEALDVTVTRIESSAPFRTGDEAAIMPYTASGKSREAIGPVTARVEADVALRERTGAERQAKFAGRAEVEVALDAQGHADRALLIRALVEGLSLAIQDLNRGIVEAIDATESGSTAE